VNTPFEDDEIPLSDSWEADLAKARDASLAAQRAVGLPPRISEPPQRVPGGELQTSVSHRIDLLLRRLDEIQTDVRQGNVATCELERALARVEAMQTDLRKGLRLLLEFLPAPPQPPDGPSGGGEPAERGDANLVRDHLGRAIGVRNTPRNSKMTSARSRRYERDRKRNYRERIRNGTLVPRGVQKRDQNVPQNVPGCHAPNLLDSHGENREAITQAVPRNVPDIVPDNPLVLPPSSSPSLALSPSLSPYPLSPPENARGNFSESQNSEIRNYGHQSDGQFGHGSTGAWRDGISSVTESPVSDLDRWAIQDLDRLIRTHGKGKTGDALIARIREIAIAFAKGSGRRSLSVRNALEWLDSGAPVTEAYEREQEQERRRACLERERQHEAAKAQEWADHAAMYKLRLVRGAA
jgi:hypothetical protein